MEECLRLQQLLVEVGPEDGQQVGAVEGEEGAVGGGGGDLRCGLGVG